MTRCKLADLFFRKVRKLEQAEELYLQALVAWNQAPERDHPQIGLALTGLAEVYLAQRRYAEAEPLLKKALEIQEKAVGPAHPQVGKVLLDYASLLRKQHCPRAAAPLEKRAKKIIEAFNREEPGSGTVDVSTWQRHLVREPSSEEIAAQQQLTIKVYNYSPAPSLTIGHAEGEAGRILLEAGIHVIWLSCRPTPAEETATLACRADSLMSPILRIAPHAIESLGRLTLGFTLPAPGGAINATVVYSRVQELVSNRADSEQKIFGYGIAHEIGHVLLGPEHSLSGLMRAQWHTSDWRLADLEQLRFSPQEAIAMGAEVVRRTKQPTDRTCPAGR
jgi:tetratricopeptide (TPR) repeat protein